MLAIHKYFRTVYLLVVFLCGSPLWAANSDLVGSATCRDGHRAAILKQVRFGSFFIAFEKDGKENGRYTYPSITLIFENSRIEFSPDCKLLAIQHDYGVSIIETTNFTALADPDSLLSSINDFKWLTSSEMLLTKAQNQDSQISKLQITNGQLKISQTWNVQQKVLTADLLSSTGALYFISENRVNDTSQIQLNRLLLGQIELLWSHEVSPFSVPRLFVNSQFIVISATSSTLDPTQSSLRGKDFIYSWRLGLTNQMPSVHEGYGLQLIDESRYVFRKHLLVGDEHFFVHDMVTGNTNQLTPETLFLNVLGGSKVSGVSVSNGFIYFLGTNAMEGRRLISLSISTPSSFSPEFITPIYRPYTNAQGQVFPGYLFSPGKQNSKGFIIHVHGGGCQQFHQTPYLYMYDPVRRALLDKGYSFYFITYSGDLQSPSNAQMDESCTSASLQRLSDVKAAIQSLRTSDSYAPIIVWGHSFGAYLVNLLATSSDQLGVTGFISQAGIWNTQIYPEHFTIPNEPNPLVSATQIKTPLLVAHGTRDESVSYSQLEEVQKFAKNAKVPVTFFSADGENHLFDADHSQIQKEWLESILHFFGSLNGSDGGA